MARLRHIANNLAWRRRFIRIVALLACIASLIGVGGTLSAYRQLDRAQRASERQARQFGDTIDQIAATLHTTSLAATNAANSADAAKTTLATAANTTRDTATTLDETGAAVNIAIPGLGRPFAGIETDLHDQSEQLRLLAEELDRTGAALTQNGRDLRAINADVARLASQMDDASARARRLSDEGGALGALAATTRLLLGWSLVIHLLLFGLGLSLALLVLDPSLAIRERVSQPGE